MKKNIFVFGVINITLSTMTFGGLNHFQFRPSKENHQNHRKHLNTNTSNNSKLLQSTKEPPLKLQNKQLQTRTRKKQTLRNFIKHNRD